MERVGVCSRRFSYKKTFQKLLFKRGGWIGWKVWVYGADGLVIQNVSELKVWVMGVEGVSGRGGYGCVEPKVQL